jgi:hypothetical protein
MADADFRPGDRVRVARRDARCFLYQGQTGTVFGAGNGLVDVRLDGTAVLRTFSADDLAPAGRDESKGG